MAESGMHFTVKYDDGREVEAVAKPKDVVAFERQYGVSFAEFMDGGARMEWIYYLAWSPLHRQKRDPRAFDEFLDDVDDVVMKGEEPAAPFDPAPSDEKSPA